MDLVLFITVLPPSVGVAYLVQKVALRVLLRCIQG